MSRATPTRRLGVIAGFAVAILCVAYAAVLAIGLLTLPSPDHQIQQPWLAMMEVLILAIAPAMVVWASALHAWSVPERTAWAQACATFMALCAAVTCAVHFCILALAHQAAFASETWARQVFSFQWPSVAYALDILAWDIFFPVAALFAAFALRGSAAPSGVRVLLFGSAALAFAGLAGVPLADMRVRNVGIVGYAVLFPVATFLLSMHGSRNGNTGRNA